MRILVTFAVEAEFAPWRKLRTLQRAQLEGLEMFQCQVGRATVDFVVTGMGMENARRSAEIAMSATHTVCIASAFAGSLMPEHKVGEVLIEVAACGICGTDIKKIYHAYVPPPQILGHEVAGTVAATGRGVTKWKLGDRVMSFHHIPCGKCFYCERRLFSQCQQYKTTGLTGGFTPNGGGFAEYVKAMPWVAERGIVALPDNVSFEEATFIEPINTILQAVQKARVTAGESVLIAGCGPIGLQLLMVANLAGAKLYTSDPMAIRRAKSLTLGALESFDPSDGKLVEHMKARTEGRGADAVLVAVAHPGVVIDALAAARPGGRVLLFAANDPVTRIEFPAAAVGIDEKEILGSYSAAVDIQEGLDLAAKPTAESLKILVTHT